MLLSGSFVGMSILGLGSGYKHKFGEFQMFVAFTLAICGGFLFVSFVGTDSPEHVTIFFLMIPVHTAASIVMAILAINRQVFFLLVTLPPMVFFICECR